VDNFGSRSGSGTPEAAALREGGSVGKIKVLTSVCVRGMFMDGGAQMRIEPVRCKCRRTAARRCPWAAKIIKVNGGYMVFESVADWETWKNQR